MTPEDQARNREHTGQRRVRRRPLRNRILVALAVIVAFAVGIALGEALHDNPRPGGQQTSLRTLPPPGSSKAP